MKKIAFLLFAFAGIVFAETTNTPVEQEALNVWIKAFSILAAGLGLGVAALGGAIGMGNTAAATIAGIARNPGLAPKLITTMFIAFAVIEAQVIYALIIALVALYLNPFIVFAIN
ncbi:F0F1 ATP synthase subunit C [Campylobacter sp. MIT 21-1685]|uniref:F0F1 ATP synthase subunit C n=1 Tax=unclassified Campylobacter TaxID=2593542 RepID=UPI00224AF766|nr:MULTISPECIES: F0F1 ATP synthase subunit C [unclassified Campylobacter]MCX2682988.1 F0F1 ATP synthase subunit C [Campylobacter sp. MIT 21-1684]MCX2751270.1 F0F1 ATP synthase subunit C [Campylobacter sp. MIT 21-1682]MCX2807469.1 F0F1 ATP synthase subunit C [Campylobacter sp. MIT 21-1685]